jgi:hypothetical protein
VAERLPEGTVTVLFTDVEGSTDLTTGRGDEAAHEILRAQTQTRVAGARQGDGPGDPSTGSGRDRDRARQLLAEAIAMYRQIGMPKHVEMAEELLVQL